MIHEKMGPKKTRTRLEWAVVKEVLCGYPTSLHVSRPGGHYHCCLLSSLIEVPHVEARQVRAQETARLEAKALKYHITAAVGVAALRIPMEEDSWSRETKE
jgi:hypothetical protein